MSATVRSQPPTFISLATAAELLSVSVSTLRRRIASGELPAFHSGRRIIRVRVSDLEKVLPQIPSARR